MTVVELAVAVLIMMMCNISLGWLFRFRIILSSENIRWHAVLYEDT